MSLVESVVSVLCMLLVLILIEWKWRRLTAIVLAFALRILVVVVVGVWLYSSTSVGPAMRRSLVVPDRITTLGTQELTPYASGVVTMAREAREDLDSVLWPLAFLMLIGVTSGLGHMARVLETKSPKLSGGSKEGEELEAKA